MATIILDEKGFVFLDDAHRPYLCRMIEGSPWLCYWNEECKCFTTLRPVSQTEILLFPHNLTEHEQDWYLDRKKYLHEQAVIDSCSDKGIISWAARDYLKQEKTEQEAQNDRL